MRASIEAVMDRRMTPLSKKSWAAPALVHGVAGCSRALSSTGITLPHGPRLRDAHIGCHPREIAGAIYGHCERTQLIAAEKREGVEDVFAVQDDISPTIVEALTLRLGG
jgi:hypothetical protein